MTQKSGYIVPTWQLAEELRKHEQRLNSEYQSIDSSAEAYDGPPRCLSDDNRGWLELLATRMTLTKPGTREAGNTRWLYRVMHRETIASDADMADAALLACGVYLDLDTTIHTFPVSLVAARCMVDEEADAQGLDLTDDEALQYTRDLCSLRDTVLRHRGFTPAYIRLNSLQATKRKALAEMRQAA